MVEKYNHLKQELAQNPNDVRGILKGLHKSGKRITKADSYFIDSLLSIPQLKSGIELAFDNASDVTRRLSYVYEGTSYPTIRAILKSLNPKPSETVVDIGCGYGRLCFYGALTTDAQYIGIDAVVKRIENANTAKDTLQIPNATFTLADAANFDYSVGDIFYMYNPFTGNRKTEKAVVSALDEVGTKKPITVVTLAMRERVNEYSGVLTRVFKKYTAEEALEIYKSHPQTEPMKV